MLSLTLLRWADLIVDIAIDFIGIYILAGVLYFRRYFRADLMLAYITVNVGVFASMSLMSSVRLGFTAGFGLFALLSILQVRARSVKPIEVAYYFAALSLGMINGLRLADVVMTVMLSAGVITLMYVLDHAGLLVRAQRCDVTLDRVHPDERDLVTDLERRLRGKVVKHVVKDVDHVRETMVIDVRYLPDRPAGLYDRR